MLKSLLILEGNQQWVSSQPFFAVVTKGYLLFFLLIILIIKIIPEKITERRRGKHTGGKTREEHKCHPLFVEKWVENDHDNGSSLFCTTIGILQEMGTDIADKYAI